MKIFELLQESNQPEPPKIRNYVAKNAKSTTSGAGAHKDRKKAVKAGEVKHKKDMFSETATAGSTNAASIGTVVNPHISPGSARGKPSYIGSPGKSGTKAPPQPKPKKQKPTDNALDMKNTSIFGGSAIKR